MKTNITRFTIVKLFLLFFLSGILSLQAQKTLVLQPGPNDGKDAHSRSSEPNINYGTSGLMVIRAETMGGTPFYSRAYIDFDLSSLPANAVIESAILNLYADSSDSRAQQFNNDEIEVGRATSSWTQSGLNWINQPDATDTNMVKVSQVPGTHPNYFFDVKNIVEDMVRLSGNSYGFRIKLKNETPYTSVYFASSENSNPEIRPKLTINYSITSGLNETNSNYISHFNIYPNPFKETLTLKFDNEQLKNQKIDFVLYDLTGRIVLQQANLSPSGNINISTGNIPAGLYLYQAKSEGKVILQGKIQAQ